MAGRFVVAVLVFLGVVSTAVGSLGAPLLPTIVVVDHVSLPDSQWALTISLLVGAVASPVLGRLGDGPHRRQVMLGAVLATLLGCVLAALPLGFAGLLTGRALQGVGLGLVPLAIATARDALPPDRARPVIALLGVTTAVGIGAGYPIVGVVTQYLGMPAAFWVGAAVSAAALVAAALALPASPRRPAHRLDLPGVGLLGTGVAGLLLALAEGQTWGWGSVPLLTTGAVSVLLLAGAAGWELRAARPLVDVRLLRHRVVLAADLVVLLVGLGSYPLLSLVVRLVQAPAGTGYGFGAAPAIAGLMLVPFSLASFAANKLVATATRRGSPDLVVALACVVLVGTMVMFRLARGTLWELAIIMALNGIGMGCVFAANPVQIVRGVPATETGSATSFYQVLRSIGFSAGSALSGTVLVTSIPAGRTLPTAGGYDTAAVFGIVVLLVAAATAALFTRRSPAPTGGG